MRTTRHLAAVAAAAVAIALPLAPMATAAEAAPLKRHVVDISGKEPRPNHFKMVGKVSPMYKLKKVQILRQSRCKGAYKIASVVKTDKNGIFTTPIYIGQGTSQTCWRAKAPASPGYAPSISSVRIRVYTF